MRTVGIHCFAGGFTSGVLRATPVTAQLEASAFGHETAARRCRVVVDPGGLWKGVVDTSVDLVFGNPRCTAFSSLSSSSGPDRRGPDATPTVDIRQLCAWGRRHWATFVVWESVCQALTVGRRLVEDEEARFRGKGYDVTHVLLTTADFGSAQNRRRYFFVASRVRFEPLPPPRVAQPTTGDVLSPHLGRDVTPMKPVTVGSTPDVCRALNRDERSVLRLLREGESLNHLAVDRHDELAAASERYGDRALFRRSGQPFGLHALRRLRWDAVCPTLHSGCRNLLHPRLDRTLSVREVAALMGWDDHPVGERPYEQCVKGIVPAVGEWVARSVETSLGNSGAEGIARRVDLRKGDASWT